MLPLHAVILLFNGLTLSIALGLTLIVLWYDARRELNQFFAFFLLSVVLWNAGTLLIQVSLLALRDVFFVYLAISITELGFTSSSVAALMLISVLTKAHSPRFRVMVLVSFFIGVALRLRDSFFILNNLSESMMIDVETYQYQSSFFLFYLIYDTFTLFLLWRYRQKIRTYGMALGILIFLFGQSLGFVNPDLGIASFSTSIGSVGALVVSFALTRQEIIAPLSKQASQVETIHRVSQAVSSQIALDMVLNEIAMQAAKWVNADASGIFVPLADNRLVLAAAHNLPKQYNNLFLSPGHGMAGTVAQEKRTIFLEQYGRDWSGSDDFPLARETFGSVICVPLLNIQRVIGVLMVISGRHKRVFDAQDVYQLELLGVQASVVISYSQLLEDQIGLARQIEVARSQLETVLTSTESPVIAIDRELKLIFANPAAESLFDAHKDVPVFQFLPSELFPQDSLLTILKVIARSGGYTYEIVLPEKVYLCHLTTLGHGRISGWVAVLNDVTELKELDRLKSEMVRMASHDLKNPLMGAMAYVDLLRDETREIPAVQDSLDVIENQLDRMNRIISGILDLERLKSTSLSLELCDPIDMVQDVLNDLDHFIADRGVVVEVEEGFTVPLFWADRSKFERALINIVENAVKFTVKDGKVTVRMYAENGEMVFSVQDNGVGIPVQIQPYIFDRFFRGQQPGVEHVTGSGLGLSLVKDIVEEHKGRIWFESVENEGTTFHISIPVKAS